VQKGKPTESEFQAKLNDPNFRPLLLSRYANMIQDTKNRGMDDGDVKSFSTWEHREGNFYKLNIPLATAYVEMLTSHRKLELAGQEGDLKRYMEAKLKNKTALAVSLVKLFQTLFVLRVFISCVYIYISIRRTRSPRSVATSRCCPGMSSKALTHTTSLRS
jgi:hypothetical protein